MVNSCVAYGCTNRWTKGSGIQFHRFPHASPELMKKWTDALRRKGWTPSKYSSVCSVHFTKDSYVFRPGADRQLLKPDAVPSIFSFHSQAKISRRSKLIRDAPTGSEAHFEESQFENNRADNWKKLKQTAIPTIFDLPNPPKPIASKRKKCPLVHNYIKSSKKSEEPELPPTVVTPARKCFVCSKEAGSTGSPLTALTNTTKTQLHQKLSKVIAAELDLVVDEDGVICNVCCRLLNYLDRIEVEQRLLTKSVVDCMRWTFGLGSLHDASRMPDAVLATIEDHSKYTRIPAEKSDLNVDDHAQAASDGAGSRSNAASASERKNQTLLVPNVTEKNKKQSLLVNRTTETKKNQTLLVDRANGKNLNSQPLLSDRASGKNLKSQPLLVDGASEKKQKSQPLLVARVIREKTDAEQDDQIYHCKVCNFESKHKSVFLFHLQRHLERGYRCDFCDVLLPKDLSYLIARMQKRVK